MLIYTAEWNNKLKRKINVRGGGGAIKASLSTNKVNVIYFV